MKFTEEIINGNPVIRIVDEKRHFSFGYYSNNSWIDEERLVVSWSYDLLTYKDCGLSVINIKDKTEEILDICCDEFISYGVHENKLYYVKDDSLYLYFFDSKEKVHLYTGKSVSFPHMTRDGRYINWQAYDTEKGTNECYLMELETGNVSLEFEMHFAKPFSEANHMAVCPTDCRKIFFAHEGNTLYVSNRLWLYEKEMGMRCIAKQRLDENGNLGDCFGHEDWSWDGKGLYFVKYPCSPLPPCGICYVDLEGEQRNAIYGKYPYWHVCASPSGKHLAADTFEDKFSGVVLINMETGEEKLLLTAGHNWRHPAHPHPSFNTSGNVLCYHDLKEGMLTVGFVKIDAI